MLCNSQREKEALMVQFEAAVKLKHVACSTDVCILISHVIAAVYC